MRGHTEHSACRLPDSADSKGCGCRAVPAGEQEASGQKTPHVYSSLHALTGRQASRRAGVSGQGRCSVGTRQHGGSLGRPPSHKVSACKGALALVSPLETSRLL